MRKIGDEGRWFRGDRGGSGQNRKYIPGRMENQNCVKFRISGGENLIIANKKWID